MGTTRFFTGNPLIGRFHDREPQVGEANCSSIRPHPLLPHNGEGAQGGCVPAIKQLLRARHKIILAI